MVTRTTFNGRSAGGGAVFDSVAECVQPVNRAATRTADWENFMRM